MRKLPKSKQRRSRVQVYITPAELRALRAYCAHDPDAPAEAMRSDSEAVRAIVLRVVMP